MTNAGYAVETEAGERIMVHNLATARWYVREGLGTKIYDTYSNRYLLVRVKV
jgi:hypothetical protein